MTNLHLRRTAYDEAGTPGLLFVNDTRVACTLELPWKTNQVDISCIPEGIFRCEYRDSPSKGRRIHVLDIEGRDHCMFHSGNWCRQILGCILPGLAFRPYDKNEDMMVESSKPALRKLEALVPDDGSDIALTITGPGTGGNL